MNLTIRPYQSVEDGRFIEEIAKAAWEIDDADVIPGHLSTAVANENGGVILLAFDGTKPIGFCWGFWAFEEEKQRWKYASHENGVIPEYRGKRVGEQLKWAQRTAVLEKGYDLITWTYDPLETLNGSLNIRKLGAICNRYEQNFYGDPDDPLNLGIPTDRFLVDWWIDSNRVRRRAQGPLPSQTVDTFLSEGGLLLNDTHQKDNTLSPVDIDHQAALEKSPRLVALAVPRNFRDIKVNSKPIAIEWRLHTRALFETIFERGYTAVNLLPGDPICYYLFEKEHP